jgi:type IV pilus assembly protein PilC
MMRFKYSGRDRKGKRSGTILAESKQEAIEKLRGEGIRVLEMNEVAETIFNKDISFERSVKLEHIVIYLRQFSTLISAGVSIVESTKILSQQTESKKLRAALIDIENELRKGNRFSEAAEKHKKIFTPMFINLVKAGEVGGSMEDTLARLAVYFEKQYQTKQKVISALTYPIILAFVAVGVVIFLLTSVVPTFVDMFADMGADLPSITKFVLRASDFMQSFWWLVILLGIGITFGYIALKQNEKAKYYLDYATLKMPIFGKMLQKAALARFTRTLSSLFSSGVPILQALSVVENVVENLVLAKVIRLSRDELAKGNSLTEPMRKHWAFPPLITQMITVGEETGALDAMLEKVAIFYEQEVENATDKLKALIEPLMIVFLAAIVGVIVLSIMMPMFDMYEHIG